MNRNTVPPQTFHMSLLKDVPLTDFDIAWEVNKATEKIDEFSRKFDFLEKPIGTFVSGECYFDYSSEGPGITPEQILNGERKIHIGVTRKYVHIVEDTIPKI